jgi:RHS repeat-associated protein
LVETYQYDPYGNLTSSTGSVANPWRFAGGYFDSGTGLYKFGARYYDPTLGRWSQQDPLPGKLTDPNSLNRYLYVSDDPVSLTDPSGKDPIPVLLLLKCVVITLGALGVAIIIITLASLIPLAGLVLAAILAGLVLIFTSALVLLFVECLQHKAWGL